MEAQEDVDVPAGHFSDCYRLVFLTNPDDTTIWFCPGVGMARLRYVLLFRPTDAGWQGFVAPVGNPEHRSAWTPTAHGLWPQVNLNGDGQPVYEFLLSERRRR